MLNNKTEHINCADGTNYPLCCTLNVLEQIQEHYGDITTFQRLASGIREKKGEESKEERYEFGPVDVPAILNGATWMINEGIEIENIKKRQERPLIENRKETARILRLSELSLSEIATILMDEMMVCIDPKKQKSTQKKTKGEQLSILRGLFTRPKRT